MDYFWFLFFWYVVVWVGCVNVSLIGVVDGILIFFEDVFFYFMVGDIESFFVGGF